MQRKPLCLETKSKHRPFLSCISTHPDSTMQSLIHLGMTFSLFLVWRMNRLLFFHFTCPIPVLRVPMLQSYYREPGGQLLPSAHSFSPCFSLRARFLVDEQINRIQLEIFSLEDKSFLIIKPTTLMSYLYRLNLFTATTVILTVPTINHHSFKMIKNKCNLWNVLPSSCFPESYNLPSFKSNLNELDLISLSSWLLAFLFLPLLGLCIGHRGLSST